MNNLKHTPDSGIQSAIVGINKRASEIINSLDIDTVNVENVDILYVLMTINDYTKGAYTQLYQTKNTSTLRIPIVIQNDNLINMKIFLEDIGAKSDAIVVIEDADNLTISEEISKYMQGIGNLIHREGLLSLDFCDLVSIVWGEGRLYVYDNEFSGDDALKESIDSTLMFLKSIKNIDSMLVQYRAHPTFELVKVLEAVSMFTDTIKEEFDMKCGFTDDKKLQSKYIKVSILVKGA